MSSKPIGRKVPHSDLGLVDFELASLTSFPERLEKFEREHSVAWDRNFFDKKHLYPLRSRWEAWIEAPPGSSFTTCDTATLTKFFGYLRAYYHPEVASNSSHIDKVTRLVAV